MGDFMPKGCCKREWTWSPSSMRQKHQVMFAEEGYWHQKQQEEAWHRRMLVWCQNAGRLPVAPTIMEGGSVAGWHNTTGEHKLGMMTEGGPNHTDWGWGSPISSGSWSRKSSLWWALRQETTSFHHHCQCHHHHYCCLLRIHSPPACSQMNRVVHQICPDSIWAERADASPRPCRLSGVCPESACLLQGTCGMQLGKEGEESLHTTSGMHPFC